MIWADLEKKSFINILYENSIFFLYSLYICERDEILKADTTSKFEFKKNDI